MGIMYQDFLSILIPNKHLKNNAKVDVSNLAFDLTHALKVRGCYSICFVHVLQLVTNGLTQHNLCVVANQPRCISKYQIENRAYPRLVMIIKSACLLIPYVTTYVLIVVLNNEWGVVNYEESGYMHICLSSWTNGMFISYKKWVQREKMSIYDPLTLMIL